MKYLQVIFVASVLIASGPEMMAKDPKGKQTISSTVHKTKAPEGNKVRIQLEFTKTIESVGIVAVTDATISIVQADRHHEDQLRKQVDLLNKKSQLSLFDDKLDKEILIRRGDSLYSDAVIEELLAQDYVAWAKKGKSDGSNRILIHIDFERKIKTRGHVEVVDNSRINILSVDKPSEAHLQKVVAKLNGEPELLLRGESRNGKDRAYTGKIVKKGDADYPYAVMQAFKEESGISVK